MYRRTLLLQIIVFAVSIVPVNALPLTNLHDPEHYHSVEIKRKFLPTIPVEFKPKIIFRKKMPRKLHLHVPQKLLLHWQEAGIPFEKLPFPQKFIELNPDHWQRLKAKCPSARNMLNGYKSVELNEKYLVCLEKEFRGIAKRIKIGNSRQGRSIYALRLRLPTTNTKPQQVSVLRDPVFIQCAVHGDEPIAIEHCYDILIQVLNYPHRYSFLSQMELWVLPITNPDGVYRFWRQSMKAGRKNGYHEGTNSKKSIYDGVDLNRNFPFYWNSGNHKASSDNPKNPYYRGPAPASEPETQAILQLFEKQRFIGALSYHCYANAILSPYTIEGVQNPQPDLAAKLANYMLQGVTSHREEKPFVVKKNLYEVDGTDTDTYYHRWGTLAYLIESSHLLQPYDEVPVILNGLRPVWENFLRRLYDMPFIRLRVSDPQNKPLVARIESNAFVFSQGEERTTGSNGIVRLPIPPDKEILLKITAPGYRERTMLIQPTKTHQFISITLEQ